MPSYAQVPERQVNIVDTFERTASRSAKNPTLQRLSEHWKKSSESSEFLSRLRSFDDRLQEANQLSAIEDNWNGYGSPRPSSRSLDVARVLLKSLQAMQLLPAKVLASAEGGVAVLFQGSDDKRAVIETLNDGESFVLLYDLCGNNETIEWNTTEQQSTCFDLLKRHLRS